MTYAALNPTPFPPRAAARKYFCATAREGCHIRAVSGRVESCGVPNALEM